MKHLYTLILAGLLATAGRAQNNSSFFQFETVPCPFDNTITIKKPKFWRFYQTLDGNWDGVIDSTVCVSVSAGAFGFGAVVNLGHIRPDKPLFVRAELGSGNFVPLMANNVFNAYLEARLSPGCADWQNGPNCQQDVCNGMFIGIAIPDSLGQPAGATRWHTGLAAINPNSCLADVNTCLPSEKFEGQYLRELVLKFDFTGIGDLSGYTLEVERAQLEDIYIFEATGRITQALFQNGANTVLLHEISDNFAFTGNYLMLYTADTYPSPEHPSYIEGRPEPNVSVPQDLTILVEPNETLEIQPFTHVRGALVDGSDSVRHNVTLVNDGGDFCFNFIDLIWEGGSEYRHSGGSVDINNAFSCMQFKGGSALTVSRGATLHYGNEGAGMLALCAGGSIVLERDATLVVDAIMNLAECDDAISPTHIYMDLPPGARLAFTEHARLTNRFSQGQQMKLIVNMLGGTIDDVLLSPEDRQLIHRVYPQASPDLQENLLISPNPVDRVLHLEYLSAGEEAVVLTLTGSDGRVVFTATENAVKGMNVWEYAPQAAGGLYFLQMVTPKGRVVKELVVK